MKSLAVVASGLPRRLTAACVLATAITVWTGSGACEGNGVLVVYSSGTPGGTISEMPAGEYDAETLPTPEVMNVAVAADRLGELLRVYPVPCRVADVSTPVGWKEVMDASVVVICTPAYFWNMSWEMKRFIDEQFGTIYNRGEERLGGKIVAVLTMAEIEPSATSARDAVMKAVTDCNGTPGPTAELLTSHDAAEWDRLIASFAEKIHAACSAGKTHNE